MNGNGVNRREFLKLAGLAGSGAAMGLSPAELRAGGEDRLVKVPGDTAEQTGGALDLPEWSRGNSSSADDTMLMFRGNPSHTFYGTGPVSEDPELQWKKRLAAYRTTLRGRDVVWTGTGWTGQAVKLGGFIFVGSTGRYVYAFEADTGRVRWKLKGGQMFKSSLCAYDNRLFIGNVDDYFRCIDAATGEVLWKYDTGNDCDSSGVVAGGKLYVGGESGYLHCFDPETGEHHWKTFLHGIGPGTKPGSNGVETSPAVHEGQVFAVNYDGTLSCVDAETGDVEWRARTGADTDASPVVVGGRVYCAAEEASPYVFCFDREKQGDVVWKTKNSGGWWSTPAVVGDRLFIGGADGSMYCMHAKTGEVLWEHDVSARVWSSPAVVDGKVIFGAYDGELHMVDAKDGRSIWTGAMGGPTPSTPIVVDGRIYVGSAGGTFRCFA